MNIKLALREYGLSEKEIGVYLALLSLGTINLQEIAKRVDYPRTTVYNTLTYLSQKGFVSKIIKKGVTFFTAAEPQKFIDRLEQKKKLLASALPELEALKKITKDTSSVEIYEGTKGLSTILSDVFKVKQQTYYFGSYTLSKKVLQHQPEHVRAIRLEKKIRAKVIIDPYDEPTFHKKAYKDLTEMRFYKELKDFPCAMFIYGEKVALYTVKGDLIGIIIKNPEVAQAMKLVFNMYWKAAKHAKF